MEKLILKLNIKAIDKYKSCNINFQKYYIFWCQRKLALLFKHFWNIRHVLLLWWLKMHFVIKNIADVWKSFTFEGKDSALSNNIIVCLILCNKWMDIIHDFSFWYLTVTIFAVLIEICCCYLVRKHRINRAYYFALLDFQWQKNLFH